MTKIIPANEEENDYPGAEVSFAEADSPHEYHSAAVQIWSNRAQWDANLIAAAPDLLAACHDALSWPEEDEYGQAFDEDFTTPAYRHYRQRLRDAIAKAEGK